MKDLNTQPKSLLKQLEDGIWQFCVDHGRVTDGGVWWVKFGMSDKRDLLRRIYSRGTGVYRIKDEEQIEKELHDHIKKYSNITYYYEKQMERQNRELSMPKWLYKIVIFLRYISNKLVDLSTPSV